MKKYDQTLIGKIAISTVLVGLINYILLTKSSLSGSFLYYNFGISFISFLVTVSFIGAEYVKNEFKDKNWFSKSLSFFADLMIISFVMAILFLVFNVNKFSYQITLMTLPYLSAFMALFTDKYRPFLNKFTEARTKYEEKNKELFRRSAERAIIIRNEREARKKRIEGLRLAKIKRKRKN